MSVPPRQAGIGAPGVDVPDPFVAHRKLLGVLIVDQLSVLVLMCCACVAAHRDGFNPVPPKLMHDAMRTVVCGDVVPMARLKRIFAFVFAEPGTVELSDDDRESDEFREVSAYSARLVAGELTHDDLLELSHGLLMARTGTTEEWETESEESVVSAGSAEVIPAEPQEIPDGHHCPSFEAQMGMTCGAYLGELLDRVDERWEAWQPADTLDEAMARAVNRAGVLL